MDSQPLISVVLPAFNRPAEFARTLEGVLHQTHRNLEVIVADDASTEDIAGIALGCGDKRIVYRRNEQRKGVTMTKVEAFMSARAEYVASAHDNHVWTPGLLEALLRNLRENPEASLAFSDHFVVNNNGEIDLEATNRNTRIWRRDKIEPGMHTPFFQAAIIDRSIPVTHAMLLRKDAVDWDDFPDLTACHDVWLAYLAARSGAGAFYNPERLSRYSFYSNPGTSPTRYESASSLVACYGRMLGDRRLREVRPQLVGLLGKAHALTGIELLREKQYSEARSHFLQALRMTPGVRIALLAMGCMVAPSILHQRLATKRAT